MRCRFEKNGIAFAVPFFIVSEISEWERESSARRGDGVFYAAFGSNNLRGFSRRQHVAEENSQLRGIERIDCEGE